MFHVEIKRSYHRARAFNVDGGQLQPLLDAWRAGRTVELGDRRWEPRDSRLTVLDGPPLDAQQLAHGQGWVNAERASRNVTAELLTPSAAVTVVAPAEVEIARLLDGLGVRAVPWQAVRDRILAGAPAGVDAAVVVFDADPSAALDAGIALGAFGGRVVLVTVDERPLPPALARLNPLRLDGAGDALTARLREIRAP